MPELLASFERTYVRDRRWPGRNERYGSAIFPEERWNHFEIASEGIARPTNSIEGFHLRNTGTFLMSSTKVMYLYERAWKRYADATNTNLTNYPLIKGLINCHVIKCHQPSKWLIVCVINYLVIKCQWLIVAWWNDAWWKVTKHF